MCKSDELRNTVQVTPVTVPINGVDMKLSAKVRKEIVVKLSFSNGCGSFMSNKNVVAMAQVKIDRKMESEKCKQ